ncbi:MAG TPA: phospholipid carrier-dependent glycosyltransferase [Actinomycetota bacterium]
MESETSVESRTQPEALEAPIEPARSQRPYRRRFYQRPVVVLLAFTALAGGLRFYHLSNPPGYVFDEVYYAKDGCYDAGFPYRSCKLKTPGEQTFTVHPPLGRWMIAGGEAAFGNRPFGWRVASAIAGTLSVLLLGLLALRLFDSVTWAGIAALLLATESLNFVQSRISMLDIFVTGFVIGGFLFLVLDRQWIDRRTPVLPEPVEGEGEAADDDDFEFGPDRAPSPIFRPWRLAAGVTFGAAAATKWSGIPPIVLAVLLAMAWERSRRKRLRLRRPLFEAIRDESFGIFWFLVFVPVVVYMASYADWFVRNGFDLGGWWDTQRGMALFSLNLRAGHPWSSRPWTWLAMEGPVSYYYKCVGPLKGCRPAEILAVGNPIIFWGSVLAFPYTLVTGILRRDWRASVIFGTFAVQYLPWFLAARTTFFFYMTPMTPFMVLAVIYMIRDTGQLTGRLTSRLRWEIAPVAAAVVILAVALFVFFFPVLTARPVSHESWQARMWFKTWTCGVSGKGCG